MHNVQSRFQNWNRYYQWILKLEITRTYKKLRTGYSLYSRIDPIFNNPIDILQSHPNLEPQDEFVIPVNQFWTT